MRELSETEQDVIKRLIEWEKILNEQPHNFLQIDLGVLFDDIGKKYNSSFKIDFNNKEINLKSTSGKESTGLSENNSFRRYFISLVHFIDYLKSERLIYLVPTDPDVHKPILEFTHIDTNKTPFTSRINDIEFIELLESLFSKQIYPTEYLIKYYEHGYRTNEEIRFKKSMKIGKCSILVAISIGLASIALTAVTFNKSDKELDITINRINILDSKLTNRLDSLNFSVNKLKVQVNKHNVKVFGKKKRNNQK